MMSDNRRRHLTSWCGALLAGLPLLLVACGDTSEPSAGAADSTAAAAVADQPAQPEQTFYDYRLIETEAGVRRWVLDSDIMHKYKDRRDVDLVRVNMDFFKDGEYHATLLADSGTADLASNDVHVWSNVVITTAEGRRLRTSDLYYTSEDGLIRNEVYNVFDRGQSVVTGIGLEATPDLDYLVIKKQVAGVLEDDTGTQNQPGGAP